MDNPFTDTLYSLEWIASAMDAARRHAERQRDADGAERLDEPPSFGEAS